MDEYVFPFAVPADLPAASDEDLRTLQTSLREHAATFAGLSPAETTDATVTALRACRDLAVSVAAELKGRRERVGEASTLSSEVDAAMGELDDPDPEPEPAPEPDPATAPATEPDGQSVSAAARRGAPRVRDVARGSRTPHLPQDSPGGGPVFATMTASADVPGFASGQPLERFADAARALSARMDQYPAMTAQRARMTGKVERRPITAYVEGAPARSLKLKSFVRHSGVQLRREFPDELRIREGDGDRRGYAVAEYAANERRLPGGSLIESARLAVKAGRSLTAAAGWCAPSEVIYDLCELETLDGLLDAPQLQTTRGGWQIPINGGPDFATIWDSLGRDGDTHLDEIDVIADTPKVCTEITCPDFDDVRLGVDYYCLTGGLLQRRGYPEVVARFGRAAIVALAHKINMGFIAAIVAGSGAATVIPANLGGDDAASSLLSAVHLAAVDAKYRNRMGFNTTLEVVLPWWALVPVRAGLSRRTGVDLINVTDAMILSWFAERGVVPRFVYDWQDAFSGLLGGPGAAVPLTELPGTVQFLIYPAGTWTKAVQDVVALDTIYDSTLLQTNQYTAVFAEDGWAALKMCALSRLYETTVDPSGVVGCCPPLGS